MKALRILLVVVSFVALVAGNAMADVDVRNIIDVDGGDANQKQKQDQKQKQQQQQKQKIENSGNSSQNATITTPRDFIHAPSGPGLMAVTVLPEAKACIPISAQSFSLEEIRNMKEGSFMEKKGGWLHGMFSSRTKKSVRSPFKGGAHHTGPIQSLDWDVSVGFKLYAGDRKLGTFNCEGDYGYPLDASLGMCLEEAYEYTNMTQVYACYTVRYDAHSSGTAYSAGGAASAIPGSGDVAAAGSVAGTFGTSVAYANKAYDIELFAVDVKQRTVIIQEPPAYVPPEPPQACNLNEFLLRLRIVEDEIFVCRLYSHNNLEKQLKAMKDSLDVWLCTGDVTYREHAIQHGQMAELNYIHGKDIRKYADSDKLVGEVEYLLASAFYARDNSINSFWKAPEYVTHVDKKRGNAKPVALTSYEKKQVEKLRCTLERYSKKLAL